MRVLLLNDGGYCSADNVKFPVEVEVSECKDAEGVDVTFSELIRVGFDLDPDNDTLFFTDEEIERLPEPEKGVTVCSITDKCCNQFGERDEIQTIINSLQADVVARGNRITELERALQGEQRKSEQLYNLALELGACSEFMKVNFACDWAVVGDNDD